MEPEYRQDKSNIRRQEFMLFPHTGGLLRTGRDGGWRERGGWGKERSRYDQWAVHAHIEMPHEDGWCIQFNVSFALMFGRVWRTSAHMCSCLWRPEAGSGVSILVFETGSLPDSEPQRSLCRLERQEQAATPSDSGVHAHTPSAYCLSCLSGPKVGKWICNILNIFGRNIKPL